MLALYVALSVIAVFLLITLLFGYIIFQNAIVRPKKKRVQTKEIYIKRQKAREENNEKFFARKPEDVSIQAIDGLTLRGWFLPSEKPTKRYVLFSHGHKCNGPDEFSLMVPFYHDQLGYNILMPDHRAHGRSDGKYMGFGALDHKDMRLWAEYLIERFGDDIEIILHGISMGAATVMLLNNHNPPAQIKLVIEDCGYTSCDAIIRQTVKDLVHFSYPPAIAVADFFCARKAGYHFRDADCLGTMPDAKNPVLFIHGDADTYVPTQMGRELHKACKVPKSLLLMKDSIHAFSYYDAPQRYEQKVAGFIRTHLGN